MHAALLTLILQTAPGLQTALEAAVTVPGARVELLAWQHQGCGGRYEVPPLDASGRVAVRVRGSRCDAWAWATVRLTAHAVVLTLPVKTGDVLDGRWRLGEVELTRGAQRLLLVPPGATATRAMRAGTPLGPDSVRVGPPPGTPLIVRAVAGTIAVEQRAIAAACPGPGACATLPGGKRVSGLLEDGVLVVSERSLP